MPVIGEGRLYELNARVFYLYESTMCVLSLWKHHVRYVDLLMCLSCIAS